MPALPRPRPRPAARVDAGAGDPTAPSVGSHDSGAVAVLGLRILRASTVALVVAGAAVAIHAGRFDDVTLRQITTVPGMLRAMFSPLVVLALGVALRLALAPAALLAALTVVVVDDLDLRPAHDTRSWWTRTLDRFRLAGAVRNLRWTTAAKRESARRLGRLGTLLVAAEWGVRGLIGVAALGVVLAALTSG